MPAQKFDYAQERSWEMYIKNTLLPLKQSAENIIYAVKAFRAMLKDRPFSELIKDYDIRKVLLGGLNADGSFSEMSLSRYYSITLGLTYDPKRYISYIYAGKDPDFQLSFRDTELVNLSNLVFLTLGSLPELSGYSLTEKRIKAESLLKDPEKLAELIADFLSRCVNFTAGYNPGTFFIWSLRKNTKAFIDTAYNELEDEENFKMISERLGLERIYVPEVSDQSLRAVWGYPEYRNGFDPMSESLIVRLLEGARTFGGKISLLNELIWLHFSRVPDYIRMTVLNAPDPLKEYIETAKRAVDEKPLLEPGLYTIKGIFIEGTNHTLLDVLDSISQHQYLGLMEYFIESYRDEGIELLRLEERSLK